MRPQSCLISEAKQSQAWLVLGWETNNSYQTLSACIMLATRWNFNNCCPSAQTLNVLGNCLWWFSGSFIQEPINSAQLGSKRWAWTNLASSEKWWFLHTTVIVLLFIVTEEEEKGGGHWFPFAGSQNSEPFERPKLLQLCWWEPTRYWADLGPEP